jgi:hydrogenase expression/formation protein HypC
MCVTYPGRVLEVTETMALVETEGVKRRASLLIVPEASVGDWVIVAAGTVLQVLEADEATEILTLLHAADEETPAMPAAVTNSARQQEA